MGMTILALDDLTEPECILYARHCCDLATQYAAIGDFDECWRHVVKAAWAQVFRRDGAEVVWCTYGDGRMDAEAVAEFEDEMDLAELVMGR